MRILGLFSGVMKNMRDARIKDLRTLDPVLEACSIIKLSMPGFDLKNGDIQRILYLCELNNMSFKVKSLMNGLKFDATDFGPQCEQLRRHLSIRGPKQSSRFETFETVFLDNSQAEAIAGVCSLLRKWVGDQPKQNLSGLLITVTQSEGGSWHQNYIPGMIVPINRTEMYDEATNASC